MDKTRKFLAGLMIVGLGVVAGVSYRNSQALYQTAIALNQTAQKLEQTSLQLSESSEQLGAVSQGLAQDSSHNANVNLATQIAGENLTINRMMTEQQATALEFHTSGQIKSSAGRLNGILCSTATTTSASTGFSPAGAPRIKLWDNTDSATTVLLATTTLSASTTPVMNFGSAVNFNTGLYVTTQGGVDCTALYN